MNKLNNTKTINYIYQQQNNNTEGVASLMNINPRNLENGASHKKHNFF